MRRRRVRLVGRGWIEGRFGMGTLGLRLVSRKRKGGGKRAGRKPGSRPRGRRRRGEMRRGALRCRMRSGGFVMSLEVVSVYVGVKVLDCFWGGVWRGGGWCGRGRVERYGIGA